MSNNITAEEANVLALNAEVETGMSDIMDCIREAAESGKHKCQVTVPDGNLMVLEMEMVNLKNLGYNVCLISDSDNKAKKRLLEVYW